MLAVAEDFYFYVAYSHDWKDVIVSICPIDYWNKNGCIIDKHLSKTIKHLLPSGMGECNEAMFDTSSDIEKTIQDLRDRGFKEDDSYNAFCAAHDPFCNKPDPYDSGWAAGHGDNMSANPYPFNSKDYEGWSDGFAQGCADS
jgi:hypothetical protein